MYNLDKFQSQAVKCLSKDTLVVAPPGSGKTTVIINRVKHLIDNGVDPKNIIVLTFTKSAAENMRSRFKSICNNIATPFFGTFHGLFYKILVRYYGEVSIISTSEAYILIKKQLAQITEDVSDDKVREVLNNISLKKTTQRYDTNFQPSLSKTIFEDCYRVYEEYKDKKRLWDFDDLQLKTIELLEYNKNILRSYRSLFKYILVDEFQDCDDIQIEFLKIINENIFCVGDEDQCIYSFRGSNPEVMVNFEEEFPRGDKIYLKFNYRSKKNIVDLSKVIINENINRHKKDIEAFDREEGKIDFYVPYDEAEQSKKIAQKIKEYKNKGQKYQETAVIYRTNMESRSIIDRFIREKIPFKLLDKDFNFFKHFICEDILAYLKLSIAPSDRESFIRIINKPFRYVSKGALVNFRKSNKSMNCFNLLLSCGDIHPFQVKKIEDLNKDILNLNRMTLRAAIDFILSDLDYLDHLKDYADKYNQEIEELLDIVEEFKVAAKDFNKIINFLAHIEEVENNLKESKNREIDAVILSTVHGVKGAEYKNVFIINAVDEIFPHKNSDNIEEERRLFYVGVTRAIENLTIYSPKSLKGTFREVSQFILNGNLASNKLEYDGGFKVGQRVLSKVNGEGTVEEVDRGVVTIIFGTNIMKRFDIKTVSKAGLISIID